MKVNGLTTKGKVLDNPFGGKAVTAYCAGLAVCFFHKVTLIQPEVYPGNTLLDIYHIKIICEYLWKDTTQQLFAIHNAKVTNTYEIMCMRGRGCNWVLRLTRYLRIAVVIGMDKMKTLPTFFSCKGKKIFAFSDTHGLHRQLEIPESADILICAGDAVEDNLNPADYEDFLNWYKSQPAKLRLFTPGNHELSFDIAPLWAETLFKTDDIVLLHDGTFSYDGINFAAITEDTARDIEILSKEIDIVIAHHPPVGILDCGVGSESIRKAIETMKPRYHLFGHAHQEGCKSLKEYSTTFINTSHCNELKNTSYEHKSDD